MSLEQKNNWSPCASVETIKIRADMLRTIRNFFQERDVLEVETPLLYPYTASDPHIHSFKLNEHFLQTSPEFAMKRLLAADSGPIYQICKAFRDEESGHLHHPEFTILEWYRPGFNHHDLMDELDALMQLVAGTQSSEKISYLEIFENHLGINPHVATTEILRNCAASKNIDPIRGIENDKDAWLDILMTHCIEPKLGNEKPIFIFDYPASQAALSKIRKDEHSVAERFELYFRGLELANGYHELTDHLEQESRFLEDMEKRKSLGKPVSPIDVRLISAMESGLPECAGVAVGLDRLAMILAEKESINHVLTFPME